VFRDPGAAAALAATRRRREELCHPSARAGHAPPAAGDTAPAYRAFAARSVSAEPALADLGFIAVGQTYAFPLELRNLSPATRRFRLEVVGLFDRPELATGTLLCRAKLLPLPAGLSCTAVAYVCVETPGFLQGQVVFGADDGTRVEVPLRAVAVEPPRFATLREAVRRSGGFDALAQHLREESATARMVVQQQQRARSAGGGGGGSRGSSRGGVSSRGGLSLGSFASRPATGGAMPPSSQLQQQQQRAGTAGSRLASAGWLGLAGDGEGLGLDGEGLGLGEGPVEGLGGSEAAFDGGAEGAVCAAGSDAEGYSGRGGDGSNGAATGGDAGGTHFDDSAGAAAAATGSDARSGSGDSGSGDSSSGSDGDGGGASRRRLRPSIPRLRLSGSGIDAAGDGTGDGSGGEGEEEGGSGQAAHTAAAAGAAGGGGDNSTSAAGGDSDTGGWPPFQRTAGEPAWSRSGAALGGTASGHGGAASGRNGGGGGGLPATTVRSIEGLGGNSLASVRLAGLQRTPQDVLARVAAQVREAEATGVTGVGVTGVGVTGVGVNGVTLPAPASSPAQLAQGAGGGGGAAGGGGALADTARAALLRTLIASQEARQVRRTRYVMDHDAAAAYIIPYGGTAPAAVPIVLRCVEEALAQPTLHSLYNGGGGAQ
jgi:hypothetical protein